MRAFLVHGLNGVFGGAAAANYDFTSRQVLQWLLDSPNESRTDRRLKNALQAYFREDGHTGPDVDQINAGLAFLVGYTEGTAAGDLTFSILSKNGNQFTYRIVVDAG